MIILSTRIFFFSSLKLKAVGPAVYSYLGDPKAACLVLIVFYRKPCSVLDITHVTGVPLYITFLLTGRHQETSVFSILQFLVSKSTRTLRSKKRQCFVIGFKSVCLKRGNCSLVCLCQSVPKRREKWRIPLQSTRILQSCWIGN